MPSTWAASRGENSFSACTILFTRWGGTKCSGRLQHDAFERRTQFADVRLDVQPLLRELSLAAALDADLGVLELVPGEHGHHVRAVLDFAGPNQLLNAGDRSGRGGFAAHAILGQCGLGFEDLIV